MVAKTAKHVVELACVVYDSTSGEVRHVHQVAVLPGAEAPTTKEIEKRAVALAKKFGRHGSLRLKVLHVAPESLKPQTRRRVDLKSLKLISEPLQKES